MRILIVDGSQMVWKRLFDMLGELPHLSTLAYAGNLAEARQCLASFQPHLLVLDMSLRDGNGLDLLKEVRAAGLDTRVAVFTNHPELLRAGLGLGADWHFDKSLDFPQLLSLLKDRTYWRGQETCERRHCHVGS
jgi:response regulator of citrate/malate metabolism